MIRELGPGKVALDFGPTQMTIWISGDGADTGAAAEAARYAVRLLQNWQTPRWLQPGRKMR